MPLADKDARRIYAKLLRFAVLEDTDGDQEAFKKSYLSMLPEVKEGLPRIARSIGESDDDILQAFQDAIMSDEYTLPPMIDDQEPIEPVPGFEHGKTTLGDPAGDIVLPEESRSGP